MQEHSGQGHADAEDVEDAEAVAELAEQGCRAVAKFMPLHACAAKAGPE